MPAAAAPTKALIDLATCDLTFSVIEAAAALLRVDPLHLLEALARG